MKNKTTCISIFLFLLIGCSQHEIRETKYPNGQLKEKYTVVKDKDGSYLWDGEYTRWYENGQITGKGHFLKRIPSDTAKGSSGIPLSNRSGKWTFWFANGQIQDSKFYKNGKLFGKQVTYYENGSKESEGNWNSDILTGCWVFYYDNGQKKEESCYSYGKKEDPCKFWYKNGNLSEERTQLNGKIIGKDILYYENGKVKVKSNFNSKGLIEGISEVYYENGNLSSRNTMKNDMFEGVTQKWYSDGKFALQATCSNNKFNGPVIYCFPSGDTVIDMICANGVIYKINKYRLTGYEELKSFATQGFFIYDSTLVKSAIDNYNLKKKNDPLKKIAKNLEFGTNGEDVSSKQSDSIDSINSQTEQTMKMFFNTVGLSNYEKISNIPKTMQGPLVADYVKQFSTGSCRTLPNSYIGYLHENCYEVIGEAGETIKYPFNSFAKGTHYGDKVGINHTLLVGLDIMVDITEINKKRAAQMNNDRFMMQFVFANRIAHESFVYMIK